MFSEGTDAGIRAEQRPEIVLTRIRADIELLQLPDRLTSFHSQKTLESVRLSVLNK